MLSSCIIIFFFFFNDTATTEIYTLSLHDALPISFLHSSRTNPGRVGKSAVPAHFKDKYTAEKNDLTPEVLKNLSWLGRSEEHTSELQSRLHLVCRLLLEKKNIPEIASLHSPVSIE